MDKYKTKSAFNKWFSPILLENLPFDICQKIKTFNHYQKKLRFSTVLKLFLLVINEEKESLRDMSVSMISTDLQQEVQLENISYSQLSRVLSQIDSDILMAIFYQLLNRIHQQSPITKRNCLHLIDSTTFTFNKTQYPWADFRKTKSGVKLHLKLCFMDDAHCYPEDFTIGHAKIHDKNELETLINQAEATYVFDRGYLDFKKLDELHEKGYFFVTRIKKNTAVHVLEELEKSQMEGCVLKDQLVTLGSPNYLTSRFRLVTIVDDKGKKLEFITNRFDCTSEEIANMYQSRWQIELFFKHIKQHMTVKKFFSQSEQGVTNQLILSLIANLLTYLIKLETKSKDSLFTIKRLFRYLIFKPAEIWLEKLKPG